MVCINNNIYWANMGVMKYFLDVVIFGLAENSPLEEIKHDMLTTARNHNIVVSSDSVESYFRDILTQISEDPQILAPYLDDEEQQSEVFNKAKVILSQLKSPHLDQEDNHSGTG